MVGALHLLADEVVELLIALGLGARLYLASGEGLHGGLAEDLPRHADAGPEVLPVLLLRHVVELDLRPLLGIGGAQPHPAARGRAHRADVGLEAVRLGRRLAVVADRHRQEVVLDVGVLDPRLGADESGGLEVVGGAVALLEEEPLRADPGLREKVQVLVERDRLLAPHLEI